MGYVARVVKGRRGNGSEYYYVYIPKPVYELIGCPAGFEFRIENGKLVVDLVFDEHKQRIENAKKGENKE